MTASSLIITGPSKFDLAFALFKGETVQFTVAIDGETKFDVVISSVQREDGSNESWNIEGTATEHCRRGVGPPENGKFKDGRVFIYFRTDRRTGNFRFAQ